MSIAEMLHIVVNMKSLIEKSKNLVCVCAWPPVGTRKVKSKTIQEYARQVDAYIVYLYNTSLNLSNV